MQVKLWDVLTELQLIAKRSAPDHSGFRRAEEKPKALAPRL
jgi:hypothetical protein